MLKKLCLLVCVLLIVSIIGRVSAAERFPSKGITIVCHASPGGVSDTVCRVIAKLAEPYLGVPVVVINKVGGGGAVGITYSALAKPDGYTVGYLPVEISMLRHLRYITVTHEDFELLMRLNWVPAALTVHADSPWQTLDQFIAEAKKRPGKLMIGNSGPGTIWHLAAVALEDKAEVKLKHVPFDGAAPAVTALLGKHVDAVTVSPAEALAHLEAGTLRCLGVMAVERDPAIPDVPTLKEQGINLVVGAWGGLGVPKETPKERVKILHDAFKKAYDDPKFAEIMKKMGVTPGYMAPEEFREFIIKQSKMFKTLFMKLGMIED